MIRVSLHYPGHGHELTYQVSISRKHPALWTDVSRSGHRELIVSLRRRANCSVVFRAEVRLCQRQVLMVDTEDRGDDVEGEEEEGGETRTTRKVSPSFY